MIFMLQQGQLGRGNASSSVRNYFDAARKGSLITLSNGNATAAHNATATWNCVASVTGHSTGKWYAEVNLDTVSGDASGFSMFGVGDTSAPTSNYCGSDTHGWSLRFTGNTPCTFTNATAGADLGTGISANQRAMVAYDAGTGKIWFGMNGVWVSSGDPGAGTGAQFTITSGTLLNLFLSSFGTLTYTLKNNPGENAHTIPSGFSMWG